MKNFLLFVLLTLSGSVLAADPVPKPPLPLTGKLIWAGIDYSHARLIGPTEFAKPETIFPAMLDAWNTTSLTERIRFMQKISGKNIMPDIVGVTAENQSASAAQIISAPGQNDTITNSLITAEIIAKAVKSYRMENQEGLAVVFIVDRLVKVNWKGMGAVEVVTFDIGTRTVLSTERIVGRAGGFGFRNYWFRVIKVAEKGLKKLR
jgi:hypothetical protein